MYKNAQDRTIFIFLNVIIFLKIGCSNLDAAPISPLLPYGCFLEYFFVKNLPRVFLKSLRNSRTMLNLLGTKKNFFVKSGEKNNFLSKEFRTLKKS